MEHLETVSRGKVELWNSMEKGENGTKGTLNHWVVGSIPTRCTPQPEGLTTEKKN
jgi:hypothetical protein